tara:strand:- start:3562 stop:4476 length:915 start_codon:yes stop_codon:yes gene_type:complete
MYKYKLKEIEVGDTEIRGGKKTTVSAIDDETGAIEWDVADVADFSSTYNALKKAKDFIDYLDKSAERTKTDPRIDKFAIDLARLFNDFRSHVRKVYPEEYKKVLRLKEDLQLDVNLYNQENPNMFSKADEKVQVTIPGGFNDNEGDTALEKALARLGKEYVSYKVKDVKELNEDGIEEQSSTATGGSAFAGGEGAQYATPFAFRKKGKKSPSIYYYKLGYKPVPKIKPKSYDVKKLFEYSEFQNNRIAAFNEIEKRINNITKLLSNAKDKTAEFYSGNKSEYKILYSTDYISRLLDEIEEKLNI